MDDYRNNGIQLGEWKAYPSRNLLKGPNGDVHLEPKAMQVLEVLASDPGRVFSRDELNDDVWDGRAVSDEPLTHCVAVLRQALGDSAKDPQYIQTIPKRGYRLVCDISVLAGSAAEAQAANAGKGLSTSRRVVLAGALMLVLALIFMFASQFDLDEATLEPVLDGAVVVERPQRSIAVMPFEDISGSSDARYFADGLTDEILTSISQLPELQVTGRTSSFFFREKNFSLPEIADRLNVAYILEGSVRRNDEDIRITAQLVNTSNGTLVWSRAYDRAFTAANLFEIQQDIATTIAARLRATLSDYDRERLERVPTLSMKAYTAYLKGRQGIATETTASLLEAEKFLKEAIALDPLFADAYAALAEVYWIYEVTTFGKFPEGVDEETAGVLISKSLELDPGLGFAHAMHGKWLEWKESPEAEAEFERAIKLSPSNPDVYLLYGNFIDDPPRKVEIYREGLRLDPMSPRLNNAIGWQLFELSRPDEAVRHYQRAIESDPDSLRAYWGLGILNWYFTGRLDESMRWLRIAYSKDPGDVNNIAMIGWTYLFLGDDVAAERWFRHAMAVAPRDFFARWGIIDVYHLRGWHDKEWAILEELGGGAYYRELVHLIDDARYEEALEEARDQFPDFFEKEQGIPKEYWSLSGGPVYRALERNVWIAMIYEGLGEMEKAEELKADLAVYVDSRIVKYPWDQSIFAKIHALLGRKEAAIAALTEMKDGGSFGWWQFILSDPQFDQLRSDPEFERLGDEIRTEVAVQLEHVREMERRGDLAMLPGAE